MEEKRMVGDYTVLHSIQIGHKEVILGENTKAAKYVSYSRPPVRTPDRN